MGSSSTLQKVFYLLKKIVHLLCRHLLETTSIDDRALSTSHILILIIIFFFIVLLQSYKGKLKLFPHNIFSEHWQFIKDYRMVKAQLPAEDCIRDIQNGRVYQKFIQHDPCARGKKALLIVVSTDGAPLIKSKKFKKPLICFLVELPPQERYKFENILLTGLWHGKSKPHLPPFLKHFTGELFNMANGSNFNNETCELVSSVCKIQSVIPHLPAKALLLK